MDNQNLVRELQKTLDVVALTFGFHFHRDQMNARTHMAQTVRWSPLTTALEGVRDDLIALIAELQEESEPTT